jgi:hydrophobic/amphiphilic exporter-1 (mainly G- bacteria), HAE1 family
LVLATDAGDNGRISLGQSVLSSFIAATCLALFVPFFFAVLQGFEKWRRARKKIPAPVSRAAE